MRAEDVMVQDRSFGSGNNFMAHAIGLIRVDLRSSASKAHVYIGSSAR